MFYFFLRFCIVSSFSPCFHLCLGSTGHGPLPKLRERMAARRWSLSLRLVTEDKVMKVIKKIKPPPLELTILTIVPSSWWLISSHPPLPTLSTCPSSPPPSPPYTSGPRWRPSEENQPQPHFSASYRPLNQLMVLSKILERCVFGQQPAWQLGPNPPKNNLYLKFWGIAPRFCITMGITIGKISENPIIWAHISPTYRGVPN